MVALSSGEAEYYAMVRAGSNVMGMKSLLEDLGVRGIRMGIEVDASAARGIAMRKGLGKVRHIDVNLLWLQDKVREGVLSVRKINGRDNCADMLTKYVSGADIKRLCGMMGVDIRRDRHSLAPKTDACT